MRKFYLLFFTCKKFINRNNLAIKKFQILKIIQTGFKKAQFDGKNFHPKKPKPEKILTQKI